MNEQTKPVTGSNEHLAEIESRIAALEAGQGNAGAERGEKDGNNEMDLAQLQNTVSGLQGTLGTHQTIISQLQNSVSSLTTKVEALQLNVTGLTEKVYGLERVNPAG